MAKSTVLMPYNGERYFWQWDIGRKLIVNDDVCCEVHFCNKSSDCALVCKVYEYEGKRVVDVPNILLQIAKPITAFTYVVADDGRITTNSELYNVIARNKPDVYVYTETEVLNYSSLDARLRKVETGGGAINGIPPGGKAGQFLCKQSDDDYDVAWSDFKIPEQYGLVSYDQDKTITIT